jgi:hypothetical protein
LRSVFIISWNTEERNFYNIYVPFFFLEHIIRYSSTKTTDRKHFFCVLHIKNKTTYSQGMFDTSPSRITISISPFPFNDNFFLWLICFSSIPAQKQSN